MKNGVIMEIRGRKAVVLTPDGEFTTIYLKRNHNLSIGSEIKLAQKPQKNRKGYFIPSMPTMAGMASIIMLFVIVASVIPVPNNDAVAAYVSFDINPSIEVGINSDLEVVQYQAWNSDGEGLNLDHTTKNMPLAEFANVLVSKLEENGYLMDQGQLLIVASNVEKNSRYQEIKNKLEVTINSLKQNEVLTKQAVAITTILHADYQTRNKAIEKGVSPGKYMTYLAAQDRGVAITLEDARNLSIKKLDALNNRATASEDTTSEENEAEPIKNETNNLENKITQLNDKSSKAVSSESDEKKKVQSKQDLDPVVKEEKDSIGKLSDNGQFSTQQTSDKTVETKKVSEPKETSIEKKDRKKEEKDNKNNRSSKEDHKKDNDEDRKEHDDEREKEDHDDEKDEKDKDKDDRKDKREDKHEEKHEGKHDRHSKDDEDREEQEDD
ncbi:anti-sigma factor domain-containing protein [Guptibacillus algicola]|uniref:anti-sigma factor domain-containing protein n=1 Tax=Guptibacillus algicola TaxID=225844 RepID=UPI001CD336E7|nr:anti-sigma factor domain-containing protein [Alkalihalobacillus algicola]MCA0986692.1 anti-sigma factor domain-containing protein [Alkalihalobacillus algicola]